MRLGERALKHELGTPTFPGAGRGRTGGGREWRCFTNTMVCSRVSRCAQALVFLRPYAEGFVSPRSSVVR